MKLQTITMQSINPDVPNETVVGEGETFHKAAIDLLTKFDQQYGPFNPPESVIFEMLGELARNEVPGEIEYMELGEPETGVRYTWAERETQFP